MFSSDVCRRATSTFQATVAKTACVRAIVVDVRGRHSSQLSLKKSVFERLSSTCEADFPCNCRSNNMFSSDGCRCAKSSFLCRGDQKRGSGAKPTFLPTVARKACSRAIVVDARASVAQKNMFVDVRCRLSFQPSLKNMFSSYLYRRVKSTSLAAITRKICFRAIFVDVRSRLS